MGSNIYISASGAVTRLRQLEMVANNLANSETVGFKADRALFHAALASTAVPREEDGASGPPGGVYVEMGEVRPDHSRGPVASTGAALDAAIDGGGFFVVETPDGERYTRAGSFVLGPEGDLTTREGHPVLGAGGPINITSPGTHIQANGDLVDTNGQVNATLRVVEFEDPSALAKLGSGLFSAPPELEPIEVESPALHTGSVEGSNVKPVVELAVLMLLQRAFDASMQAMQADDQATNRLIQEMTR